MAHKKHLAILRQGVGAWNAWRSKNSVAHPDLNGADLRLTDLSGADLSGAHFNGAHFNGANLSGADLTNADLTNADLTNADLSEAHLTNADLSEASLSEADLTSADLTSADLTKAHLIGASLRNANLSEANLNRAHLFGANLRNANFSRADLRNANLSRADLTRADLTRADFTGTFLSETLFADVDLRTVEGLNQVEYRGPSEISISTLYRSEGKIPETFLRGCGVPDSLIEYIPSLIGALQPIQYYSCFISYSGANEEFARRLHGRMQQAGLRVWFAPHDLQGGHKLYDQIDEAIRVYDKLILVLSEASTASGWVETEIRRARRKEHTQARPVLFPIRLLAFEALQDWSLPDPDTGHDLAVDIRRYFIPDFTAWKNHDAFEEAFTKLLTALKATTLPSGGSL